MKTQNCFLLTVAASLLLAGSQTRAAGPLSAVSAARQSNVAGAGGSFTPSFSGNGRFVVFLSHANNLVTNDDLAPYLDVFVRDLTTSNTLLVSVNLTGIGGGNGDSSFPSISSDGQFVAFASAAGNLAGNDTNGAPDIFVRDLVSGVTRLVSVDVTGTSSAGSLSSWTDHHLTSNPLISADGGWVVFESLSTNLVGLQDTNQMADVFARDLESQTTFLVSINAAGTGSGNGGSELASISPDGGLVAFVSTSSDLVPGATNHFGDIYVRDLQAGTTAWASSDVAGFFTNNYRCFNPVLSANGQYVAFKATSLADASLVLLIRHDLQTGLSTILCSNSAIASWPEMSADGRFIASESSTNIYVWDLQTGSNVLVNINAAGTGPGNQGARMPAMTPDGRRLLFLSAATDLATNAANGASQVFVRDLVAGTTRLVSANLDGVASSRDIDITLPAISADGRWVAFESMGADLVANDLNQASDIFLRDLDAGTTELVSQADPGVAAGTAPALTTAFPRSMSADGRYVAIGSFDNDFADSDTNGLPDIFVRDLANGLIVPASVDSDNAFATNQAALEQAISADGRYVVFGRRAPCLLGSCAQEGLFRRDLVTGTTVLVSVRADGTGAANGSSSAPAISSDGNLITFQSAASDLINGFYSSDFAVFVRDMSLGTTKLVSINRQGWAAGGNDSLNPVFSPDDRWIVFASQARDLTTNATGGFQNLFARNLALDTTIMISVGPDGGAVGYARGAVCSADSRYVAFVSATSSIVVYDLVNQTSSIVSAAGDNPSISADGRLVAYETPSSGTSPRNIVVKDLQTGLTNLISMNRQGTAGGNGDSTSPLLSWDGLYVVFASKASDLVDNDTNNASDIFVRNRLLGTTLVVSMNLQGTGAGNGPSTKPVLAAEGRTVVFQSFASDLVPGDYNYRRDVFVLHLGGPDTDGDGMDDDWEMACFGTLARDGTGDSDGDGMTDLQEFLAGTDPTNSGSALHVLTLTPLGGGVTRVIWGAAPGKRYQVQFKDRLADTEWNTLPGVVIASGTTASLLDSPAGVKSQRFYRVILAP